MLIVLATSMVHVNIPDRYRSRVSTVEFVMQVEAPTRKLPTRVDRKRCDHLTSHSELGASSKVPAAAIVAPAVPAIPVLCCATISIT